MDGLEQLNEWALIVAFLEFMTAVEIHDLAEQRYLLHSARNEDANLSDDLFDRTAALRSARLWNDAECAMHVAALHDRHKRGCLFLRELLTTNRRLRSSFLLDIDDRKSWIVHRSMLFSFDGCIHVISDAVKFLGADNQIDVRQIFEERCAARLGHAAKKPENNVGSFGGDAP